jgi:hypothetical protein
LLSDSGLSELAGALGVTALQCQSRAAQNVHATSLGSPACSSLIKMVFSLLPLVLQNYVQMCHCRSFEFSVCGAVLFLVWKGGTCMQRMDLGVLGSRAT